jgi:hypothetical protein
MKTDHNNMRILQDIKILREDDYMLMGRHRGPGGFHGFGHRHGRFGGFGHGHRGYGGFGHMPGGPGMFGPGPGRFYHGPRLFRPSFLRRRYYRPGGCLGCLTFIIATFIIACVFITTLLFLL